MARRPDPAAITRAVQALRNSPEDLVFGSLRSFHHLDLDHAHALMRVLPHGLGLADLAFAVDEAEAVGESYCRITPDARADILQELNGEEAA